MVISVNGACRGFFVASFVFWYSAGVWKALDDHFGGGFKKYLEEEFKKNERMREDVRKSGEEMKRSLEGRAARKVEDAVKKMPDGLKRENSVTVLRDFEENRNELWETGGVWDGLGFCRAEEPDVCLRRNWFLIGVT